VTEAVYWLIFRIRAAIWRIASTVREALAGFAGARRLDGGVERQQIGLPRDVADQRHHVADLTRAGSEAADLAVGGTRFLGCLRDDIIGVGELAADLAGGARQFVGGDRGAFHIDRGFVIGLDRAVRPRAGLVGGAGEDAGGRAHCAGAVADGGEQCLRLRAEGADRAVDGDAALFLVAGGGAFFLGAALLGDVFMRRDPAAAWQRLVLGEHHAAVARLHVVRIALALAHAVEDAAAVALDVAGEQASPLAVLD